MDTFRTYNPYDNSLIGEFTYDEKSLLDSKLDLLDKGKIIQNKMSAYERAEILQNLSILLKENSEKLAKMITMETGKTISDSLVEMARAQNTAFCSSVEARSIVGEVLDSDAYLPMKGRMGIVKRKPIGTILCITPFNFPINLALHKIGPAFAAGNTILFKPGPANYQSGKMLVDLCHLAGMKKEIIQFCYPKISDLTEIIEGDRIQCISFTGGTKTADEIAKRAGRKKLLLELGGNDPMIVMPDANIEQACKNAINNRFGTAGQKCTATKRLFVHETIYEEFKKILVLNTKDLKVGDPTELDTFCGPLINKQAADVVEDKILKAIKEGASLLIGGTRSGNIIFPTILENVDLNSELICDETFGPVIPLVKFNNLDEVISIVNSTPFGLQAGVFTNDIRLIEKLYNELDVGALIVNDGPGFRAEHFPFGGVKNSGIGREGIRYAINEMSILKTLVM